MYFISNNYLIKETILGEKYVLNKKDGSIYDLNDEAYFILTNITCYNLGKLIEKIEEIYEIDKTESLVNEINDCIEEFCKIGILSKE